MPSHLASLLLFTGSSSITPGPNNFMLLNSGLNFGVRRTIPHYLGIATGFWLLIFACATGLGSVFAHFPTVRVTLEIVGAVYLFYLSWKIAQSSSTQSNATHSAKPLTFRQAFAFQWVNPKAWMMGISVVSLFHLHHVVIINALLLSSLYVVSFLPCGYAWLRLGTVMQRLLNKPRHVVWFNRGMGFLLACSVVLMLCD